VISFGRGFENNIEAPAIYRRLVELLDAALQYDTPQANLHSGGRPTLDPQRE
jgi:hypothetical protein